MSRLPGWARPWSFPWSSVAAAPPPLLLLLLLVQVLGIESAANATATVSTCGSAELNLTVGEEVSMSSICKMPGDVGCAKVVTSFPVPSYAKQPLIARFAEVWAPGLTSVELKYTFRGFDNSFSDGTGERKVSVAKRIVCTVDNATETEEDLVVFFNITVRVSAAVPRALAWVPPARVDVPCLVVGEETSKHVVFTQQPDLVGEYRPLQGGWIRGGTTPWVFSRPAPDTAEATMVLERVDSGPSNGTLTLVFMALPGTEGIVPRRQCIYPGDGYNHYEQLCTEPFAVRISKESCDRADVIMGQVDGAPMGVAAHMLLLRIAFVVFGSAVVEGRS